MTPKRAAPQPNRSGSIFAVGKRLTALLLTAFLLLAAACTRTNEAQKGADIAAQTPAPETIYLVTDPHENVSLSDLEYVRPDMESLRAQMDDLLRGVEICKPASEMVADYETIRAAFSHAQSMSSLAYLLYAFDVTEPFYKTEYAYLQSELAALEMDLNDVSVALFESSDEAEKLAIDAFGEAYIETVYEAEERDNAEAQALLDEAEEQTLLYDELIATFSILDNGKRRTLDDILGDATLSYDSFYRLYDAYCAALNEQAGEIFLKQLRLRDAAAKKLGYGSYAAYEYDCYLRDYTILDAQKLHAAVKEYIVPLYIEANEKNDTYDLYTRFYDLDAFLAALAGTAPRFSPLLGEACSYLLANRLYDFTPDPVKMETSFTTYLSDERAPFIFMQWGGQAGDVATVLHELGHFTSFYHNGSSSFSDSDSLDLAEFDSQALVLLMAPYYEAFYGSDMAPLAEVDQLLDALYALLSGCMEDEFQQRLYQNPNITLSEINALYASLAAEYGISAAHAYKGTEWTLITHTFQTPLYYISYAVSIVPALELFERSLTDSVSARQMYFDVLRRGGYAGFRETLSRNGLSDVFAEGTIKRLASSLRALLCP